MGGGGVIRAAAKVAGIGSLAGGFRTVSSMHPPENLASSPTHKVPAIVSSRDGVFSGGEAVDQVQRPSWEIDDWEFAGYEDDPLPRVVFGGVPTIEEAKDATLDLKNALDMVHLTSPSLTELESSFIAGQKPSLPMLLSNSESTETIACATSEIVASKHAIHAFKLLSENPEAQNVVASIACDPNVWNAVMQNKELKKYVQSHKIGDLSPETVLDSNKSDTDVDLYEQDTNGTDKPIADTQPINFGNGFMSHVEKVKSTVGNGFMSYAEKVKSTVMRMFNSLSSFVQKPFGGSVDEKKHVHSDGSSGGSSMDKTMFGTFFALAVFVVMLVVMKRR